MGAWLAIGGSARDPEADAAVATLRAFEDAVKRHDIERLRELSTEKFYADYFKRSGSAGLFAESDPELAVGRAITRKVEHVNVNGNQATIAATVDGADAPNVDAVEVRLVKVGGAWIMDGLAMRKRGSTGGSQLIGLTLRDFAFAPEPLLVRTGEPLVLRAKNAGSQPHMIGIWSVPQGAELIKVIEATEAVPEGVQRFVQSSPFLPGDEGDVTLSRPLKPGRYMLTCFLSDITSAELTPHYDLGMLTEFTVK